MAETYESVTTYDMAGQDMRETDHNYASDITSY